MVYKSHRAFTFAFLKLSLVTTQLFSLLIKPYRDTEKPKPNNGKAIHRMDKRSQHQGSSGFEKETQLQPMQLLDYFGRQLETAQADS